jgi:hypothetical protein
MYTGNESTQIRLDYRHIQYIHPRMHTCMKMRVSEGKDIAAWHGMAWLGIA